eukprot:PLAT6563.2.p1 GENE.PLAT6563.2~~PLAT6563.2.p1  ORF type:complete len:153 (-),score=77.52 PLAT6563.2:88-546(-)
MDGDDLLARFEDMLAAVRNGTAWEEAWDMTMGFIHAVRWTEPLMLGLYAFHACFAALILLLRGRLAAQGAIFLVISAAILAAAPLNRLLAANWRAVATQNYFTTSSFVAVVYAGPLLALLLLQVILLLREAALMVVKIKRAQLRAKAKKKDS